MKETHKPFFTRTNTAKLCSPVTATSTLLVEQLYIGLVMTTRETHDHDGNTQAILSRTAVLFQARKFHR